jgi:ABC-type transporter Mla subunit MlaD
MPLLNPGSEEMVNNTIEKIEGKIRTNSSLTEENKTELLDLLAILKPEITELSKAHTEHAESIAGFIERSTHEVMRRDKNPTLIKHAIDGLSASVKGFEASHPQLVENVNYIANALANMGI